MFTFFFRPRPLGTSKQLSRSSYVYVDLYFSMPDGPLRPQNIVVPSRGCSDIPKNLSDSRPTQAIAYEIPSVQGCVSFHKISFDSRRLSGIPKISSDLPTAFSDHQFSRLGPLKALYSSQTISTIRKSCSRSRNIFCPDPGQEPPRHFTWSRSRQKQRR